MYPIWKTSRRFFPSVPNLGSETRPSPKLRVRESLNRKFHFRVLACSVIHKPSPGAGPRSTDDEIQKSVKKCQENTFLSLIMLISCTTIVRHEGEQHNRADWL